MISAFKTAGLVAVPLFAWWVLSLFVPHYLIASPQDVARVLCESWRLFLWDVVITSVESLGGLVIGLLMSFVFAILLHLVPKMQGIAMPYAIALKSTPIVAIAPLLVIWLGNGLAGKVVLAALICFFPLLVGLLDGMGSLPKEMHLLAAVWSNSRVRTLVLLELPYAVPYLFSALKVAAPLATVGAVVAEFSGADQGVGHDALIAAYRTDTALLFASVLLISAIGISFYSAVAVLERACLAP